MGLLCLWFLLCLCVVVQLEYLQWYRGSLEVLDNFHDRWFGSSQNNNAIGKCMFPSATIDFGFMLTEVDVTHVLETHLFHSRSQSLGLDPLYEAIVASPVDLDAFSKEKRVPNSTRDKELLQA